MTVSIGAFSTNFLTAQPYGHDGSEVIKGLTARSWEISGLLTSAEWLSLNTVYRNWRDLRINDPDTLTSLSVGTTVLFSGDGFGNTWTDVACWFTEAPSSEQAGGYVNAKVRIVDANEKLQVLIKEAEDEEDLPNLGTFTIGSTVITLTEPPETLEDLPQLQATAAGPDYIQGPLSPRNAFRVKGHTDSAGWAALIPWAKTQVSQARNVGDYWVTQAPTATAENKIIGGVKIVRYNVEIGLAVIK